MLRKLSNSIRNITGSPYVLFITFLSAFYVFHLMSDGVISKISVPLLDSFLTGYTRNEAIQSLELMGPSNRELYLTMYTRGYDLIFPILLCIIMMSMLSKTYPLFSADDDDESTTISTSKKKSALFNLTPLIYLLFDEAENYCHYKILSNYPSSLIENYIYFGSYFCWFKYITLFIVIPILIIGFFINTILFVKQVISNRSYNSSSSTTNKKNK